MKRIMLYVAYDGTAYHGWQIQKNGDTIEAQLKRALGDLFENDGEINLIGASRTDSGVHALCNVAVFDTDSLMPASKVAYALNARLPEDIRIQKSMEVPRDFHPRKTFSMKTYEYRIWRGEFSLPTVRLYSHFIYVPLDVAAMKEAAKALVGEHDFRAFCSAGGQQEDSVRTIYSIDIMEDGGKSAEDSKGLTADGNKFANNGSMLTIRIKGSGFLYNMVRIIAGTLVEVGKGALSSDDIPGILNSLDRKNAGPTLPARGLTLTKYEFPDCPWGAKDCE